MSEPTRKSDSIEKLLSFLSGDSREEAITSDRCVAPPIGCGQPCPPNSFRDDLSRREFLISGLYQKCQDSFFKEPSK